jgi:tetratricopeptide (TPR) repeat protein
VITSEREAGEDAAAVATAMALRAQELCDQDRFEAALVLCGELVERFGSPLTSAVRSEVNRAAAVVGVVQSDATNAEAVDSSPTPAQDESGESAEVVISRKIAWAILTIGVALDRLDRHDAELEAYDEVVARYCDATDEQVLWRVAWALYDKALTLTDLGRQAEAIATFDRLITRFGSAPEPELRGLTSWSLWKKIEVLRAEGREADALAVCKELIARDDEAVDPALSEYVAWCLRDVARELEAAGRTEEELEVYDALIGRFGESTDHGVESRVAYALAMKAYQFRRLQRVDDELAAYDEMAHWYGRSPRSLSALRQFIDSLWRKAETLETLGRTDEALVLYDSAVAAYVEGADGDSSALTSVVLALLRKAARVSTSDHVRQLATLLSDVDESRGGAPNAQDPLREEEIAELLAKLCSESTWVELATCGDDDSSCAAMSQRALELFRPTDGWLGDPNMDLDTPAAGAATLVRVIAGGYALLSGNWGGGRQQLPMPSQLFAESLIRGVGIDEWAAELGHPIELSASEELAEELMEDEQEQSAQWDPDLTGSFLGSIRQYEMLELLWHSPSGRAALQHGKLRNYARERIRDARYAGPWAAQQCEEAMGAASASMAISEALFVACYTDSESAGELFPSREFLRRLLNASECYEWLESQDIELPTWLDHSTD